MLLAIMAHNPYVMDCFMYEKWGFPGVIMYSNTKQGCIFININEIRAWNDRLPFHFEAHLSAQLQLF